LLRTFPLLHQPARQHAGGVFLHPQIEKRADLVARLAAWLNRRIFAHGQRVGGGFCAGGEVGARWTGLASRMVLFRLYYLWLAPLRNALALSRLERAQLGKLDGTNPPRCGKELLGRSMFPPL